MSNSDISDSSYKSGITLLEYLRQNPGEASHPKFWSTESCAKVMRQICGNLDEFPTQIEEIEGWYEPTEFPKDFCVGVYIDLVHYMCPPHEPFMEADNVPRDRWRQLLASPKFKSRNVTEDELEVAIRLFPSILNDKDRKRSYRGIPPILWTMFSHKSFRFVPLFAKLGDELGVFEKDEAGGLWPRTGFQPLRELFSDGILVSQAMLAGVETDEDFDKRLDEMVFNVMKQLNDNGLLPKEACAKLFVESMFRLQDDFRLRRIEKRLRLILDLHPNILKGIKETTIRDITFPLLPFFLWHARPEEVELKEEEMKRNTSLYILIRFNVMGANFIGDSSHSFPSILRKYKRDAKNYRRDNWRQDYSKLFQIILEHGIWHYPEEVGFLFRSTPSLGQGDQHEFYDEVFGRMGEWEKEVITKGVGEVVARLSKRMVPYGIRSSSPPEIVIPKLILAVSAVNGTPWTEPLEYQGRELQASILYFFLRQDPIKTIFILVDGTNKNKKRMRNSI